MSVFSLVVLSAALGSSALHSRVAGKFHPHFADERERLLRSFPTCRSARSRRELQAVAKWSKHASQNVRTRTPLAGVLAPLHSAVHVLIAATSVHNPAAKPAKRDSHWLIVRATRGSDRQRNPINMLLGLFERDRRSSRDPRRPVSLRPQATRSGAVVRLEKHRCDLDRSFCCA
jgi:hypothetical protein